MEEGQEMAEHFKEICSKCGTVVSQCHCPDPNKKVTYVICGSCLKKTGTGVQSESCNNIEKIKDLTWRLRNILMQPGNDYINLMRQLRDELNVVLGDPAQLTKKERRREQSRNCCGN